MNFDNLLSRKFAEIVVLICCVAAFSCSKSGDLSVSDAWVVDSSIGQQCSLTDNEDGTFTITCGEVSVVIDGDIEDLGGEPCFLVEREDGTRVIECGDHSFPADGPPEIRFVKPSDGETVYGAVEVILDVETPAGLENVVLYLDGEMKASWDNEPFVWEWDTSGVSDGSFTLEAVVTDTWDRTDSAEVTVNFLSPVRIFNPYADVDWDIFGRHKANFHTHTTESDGNMTPAENIDEYHSLGYDILAITDHNRVTWSWEDFGRDSADLGMIAVQGNEPSRHHHMGSYFNDYNGDFTDLHASLQAVADRDGLAVLFHPGRYSFDTAWYVDIYETYDFLVGMEVYNQGDRYPGDRALWDEVLAELMPERPVWGFSNDDAHRLSHIGRNHQTLLLPELTEEAVRSAMVRGEFYFSYTPVPGDPAPEILHIAVNENEGFIVIDAEGATDVHWISGGETILSGNPEINVRTYNGYLRIELDGPAGTTYTQPFFVGDRDLGAVIPPEYMQIKDDGLPLQLFNRRPSLNSGWSTRVIPGGNTSHTTVAHLDTAIQDIDAGDGEWQPLRTSSTWPTSAHALGTWNENATHGRKLQTRPTSVAAAVILATLENRTDGVVSSIEVFYDFGSWLLEENEHIYGHRVFYSLTGEPGSWITIHEFSSMFSPTAAAGETALAAVLELGAWEPGGRLYIMWADDNGPGGSTNSGVGREGAYTIDNFGVQNVTLLE